MSSIFGNGSKGELVLEEQKAMSMESLETVRPEAEEEESEETDAERLEREKKTAGQEGKGGGERETQRSTLESCR